MSTRKSAQFGKIMHERGVVLVVALIMLMVLSILASVSIKGASSTEQIANQSRQKALAQQTAEAALRFCEQQVVANAANPVNGFAPEAPPVGAGVPFIWETMNNWDALAPAASLKTVAIAAFGDVAGGATYFARPPECMAQYTTPGNTKVFVTTARGFGPEVSGVKDGNPPRGTEVWNQSLVTLN